MANFSNDEPGRIAAEDLCKTRMTAGTWIEGFMCVDKDGNTQVRFIRPIAPTSDETRAYGGWETSRDTAAE